MRGDEIALSVVLIVRHPEESPDAVLAALLAQPGADGIEVILVDGRAGTASQGCPGVTVLAAPGLNMPRLKALGAETACRAAVAFLEPKGVPGPGWLAAALAGIAAHPGAALGGAVTLAPGAGSADQAAFMFEYAPFSPRDMAAGGVRDLPGNNMILPRAALWDHCGNILRAEGLNKPFCQERLIAGGVPLAMLPDMAVTMHTRYRTQALLASRFRYARCFGGTRTSLASPGHRWAYRLGAPLVPALLLVRHLRVSRAVEVGPRRPGMLATLAGLCLAWAAGEALGAWAGPGGACDSLF